jgi:Tfp pilus assembly PilM family ATPase
LLSENDVISWSTSDVAGVNFGDSHITVARLRGQGGGPFEVTHAGWGAYDPGASEEVIAAAIKSLWRKTRLPTTTVVASVRSAALVVRYFKYPSLTEHELQSALELQAEECLQVEGDQLVVDCHINRREVAKESGRKSIEGVLAAAPSKDVDRLLNILSLAGLDPIILDVRSMAIANLYAALVARKDDATVCVVNVAPHSADVVVLPKSGAIYPHTVFCRASTWGESPTFLCENIRDVMKYSEFKLDWEPVQRVVLTGEMPSQSDFMAKIQAGTKIPVEWWDPLGAVSVRSESVRRLVAAEPEHAGMLVSSLGLALRRG